MHRAVAAFALMATLLGATLLSAQTTGSQPGRLRLIHAAPDGPAVTAMLGDGRVMTGSLTNGQSVELVVEAGIHRLTIVDAADGVMLADVSVVIEAGVTVMITLSPSPGETGRIAVAVTRSDAESAASPVAFTGAAGTSPAAPAQPAGTPAPVATAPPDPTPSPTPTPAPSTLPQPGQLLVSERFDDPAAGVLPRDSADTSRYFVGYVNGEYSIQKRAMAGRSTRRINLPEARGDVSIAADARLMDDATNRHVFVGCRYSETNGETNAYRLLVYPARGQVVIARYDAGRRTDLARRTSEAVRRGTLSNRLELTCAGSRIEASLNGAVIASVFDTTHSAGLVYIGVGASSDRLAAEARFDNLVVTQR